MNATTEWFEIERIGERAYRITEGMGYLPCNTYLLGDDGEWLLIDAGLGIGDLRAHVEGLCGTTPRVLLTHTHWDHIGAAHQFDDVLAPAREQTDGVVSAATETAGGADLPSTFVDDWLAEGRQFPDEFDPSDYEIQPISGVRPVRGGDRIELGSDSIELLPIPGHSPGQLAALDRTAGVCYGADVLSPGGEVLAPFDDSDVEAYADAVDRLIAHRDDGDFDVLATGHGPPRRGDELAILDDIRTALDAVAAGEASADPEDGLWGPAERYTVGGIDVVTQRS